MRDSVDSSDSYRWVVVFAGVCCLFSCLGIGRFALGMLLPSMGESLHLDYSQMGLISTLNFTGYLLAVLLCGTVGRFVSVRPLITLAMLMVGVSMILIGCSDNATLITGLYFLTGMGSGFANVYIMALVPAWFSPSVRGRAAGLMVSGNGLGIVMTGYLVPAFIGLGRGWQLNCFILDRKKTKLEGAGIRCFKQGEIQA